MGRQGREGGAGALERWIPKASVQTYLWGLVALVQHILVERGGGKKEISMTSDRPCPAGGASNSENIHRESRFIEICEGPSRDVRLFPPRETHPTWTSQLDM